MCICMVNGKVNFIVCSECDEKFMYYVCDNDCLKCSNTCCSHRKTIAESLVNISRKRQEEMKAVDDMVANLYKVLAPQIDAIMLSNELSRTRNQRYLDRLAYGEAACSRESYNNFDFDHYDDSQRFFERQHKL